MPEAKMYIRVKQALNWLKRNRGILQKDIAEKIGMAESSFTRALSRCKEADDEDFVILFHSAVNKYISLDYLLYGEGELTIETDNKFENMERALKDAQKTINGFDSPKQTIDQSSLVNAALAAKDETIASQKETIASQKETIASQKETIESLKREKELLLQKLSKYETDEVLGKFPFTPGVADSKNNNPAHV